MRIGTWNMEGRRSAEALTFLGDQACDVLLLTEVPTGLALEGYGMTEAGPLMRAGVHWAAVASRSPLDELVSPHPATLAAWEPVLRSQDRPVWELSLTVPTAILAHRIPGIFSIDHIATPTSQPADAAVRVQATQGERRLSDHDLYRIDMKL